MNLAIHARRTAASARNSDLADKVRARARPLPLDRPWFVRTGLLLAAYQARGIDGARWP